MLGVRIPPGLPFYGGDFTEGSQFKGHMKKAKQKPKKKKASPDNNRVTNSNKKLPQKKPARQKSVQGNLKKGPEKKGGNSTSIAGYIDKSRQFLRESKMELKKVKWPTKKELMGATAVVIFLALLMALYFGIVDFCLIKIIKAIIR